MSYSMNGGSAGAALPAPLACLRLIAGEKASPDALRAAFSEENALLCPSDPIQAVMRAAASLDLAPALCPGDLPEGYEGPLVTECPAGRWIVIGEASCLPSAAGPRHARTRRPGSRAGSRTSGGTGTSGGSGTSGIARPSCPRSRT